MATPSKKDEGVELYIKERFGFDRRIYIEQNLCVPAPIGCGQPVGEFRDAVSKRDYPITGLCQKCQDQVQAIFERLAGDA